MSLQLSRDGKRVGRFLILSTRKCTPGGGSVDDSIEVNSSANDVISVRGNGSFVTTGPVTEPVGDKTIDSQVSVHGQVGPTRATGTYRLDGVLKDATGKVVGHCDTGTVRWTAFRTRVYAGATADGKPVAIRLTRRENRIASFFIGFGVKCGGSTYFYAFRHADVAVDRNGRFSKQGLSGIPIKTPQGSTVSGHFSLSGTLKPRTASGRYRASGTLVLPDRSRLHCDTGSVRWSAERG